MLVPPPSTLGAAALAVLYANLIIVLEKMIRSPRAVGADARNDLYGMLPASVRGQLRARLRGVGQAVARDAGLAAEWRTALARIAEWLGPVAHDTIRWQGELSFERRSAAAPRANVLLLQTLYFADREKVEAAVTELLVGLNYLWRFEREMSALAFAADHGALQQ
ncbi:avr9 Cf-9 rapidly elicited protein [Musa troglodytarum]|uniref:Avr9 Cf-9 rapidly elicited protein n=1 Tax=Musa troglodytarum TaxID=320322 RepID=A0A9E7HX91_9LILI|nr:avr9 Cf-9 rapidly elicited protein [Musa troglodytarum]